ncbi:uncharacterized protein N7477_006803 [Penicillium maclennaniae]|uniref:uncharacterized protein n=1 Tax=Penicillium maclennaniae TaxID=1343394 RepID=UPI0025407F63|nr:uncharacterized protein N7477_006803 [Penicillium maclennaniae]KAJ5668233.1 hypothetical protein N7477_006803 [Penicillium maclennaniae]
MAIPSSPKLDGFDVLQTNFKHVGDHPIRTDILVPEKPHTGKRPVILRFHGGGLKEPAPRSMKTWKISGPGSTPPSLAELLAAHTTPTEVDLDRILTAGESAGGLLSVYLALSHPNEIRAATAAYPAVDIGSDDYGRPRASPCFGNHVPESVIQAEESAAQMGTAESSITKESRIRYMLAALEHGMLNQIYERGTEGVPREVLYPMVKLEKPGLEIPVGGIAIIQGRQDSVVPAGGVEKFVERAREVTRGKAGNEGLVLTIRDGEHGFDEGSRYSEEWLRDTFKVAVDAWVK